VEEGRIMSPWWLLLIIPGVVCVTLYFIGMLNLGSESDAYLRGYHDGAQKALKETREAIDKYM
jgi:hypothetical protein